MTSIKSGLCIVHLQSREWRPKYLRAAADLLACQCWRNWKERTWSLWVYEAKTHFEYNRLPWHHEHVHIPMVDGLLQTQSRYQKNSLSYNVNSCEEGSSHYFLCCSCALLMCFQPRVSPKVSKGAGIFFSIKKYSWTIWVCVLCKVLVCNAVKLNGILYFLPCLALKGWPNF